MNLINTTVSFPGSLLQFLQNDSSPCRLQSESSWEQTLSSREIWETGPHPTPRRPRCVPTSCQRTASFLCIRTSFLRGRWTFLPQSLESTGQPASVCLSVYPTSWHLDDGYIMNCCFKSKLSGSKGISNFKDPEAFSILFQNF